MKEQNEINGNNMTDKEIMEERGKTYGAPLHRFALVTRMYDQWEAFRVKQGELPPQQEQALRHGVHLIIDKLSRMAVTPRHQDTLTDISGYAECIRSIVNGPEET